MLLASGCVGAVGSEVTVGADDPPQPAVGSCADGELEGPDGRCMPVGIPGCAGLFMGMDGLCHPSSGLCPPGTVARFDEGCVAVGIPRCADVFRDDDGICRPAMAKCPAGTIPAPEEGCLPIDGDGGCGAGTWGDIPVEAGNIYVDPSYQGADGDGSQARPVTTIAAAAALVDDGGRIALAAGVYDEPVAITRPIELAGRCPSMVRVQGTREAYGFTSVILVDGASGAAIRGVEVGGAGVGIHAIDAPDLVIAQTRVRGALEFGVRAEGAATSATIERCVVADTAAGEGGRGVGVVFVGGAKVVARASAFTGNRLLGIGADGAGGELSVEGSLVEGTSPASDGRFGDGISASGGVKLSVDGSAVLGSHNNGISGIGTGTSVAVSGSLVEDTAPELASGLSGFGISLQAGASGTIGSSVVSRSTAANVFVDGGSELTMKETLSQDCRRPEGGPSGLGVQVSDGARAILRSSAVLRNEAGGVLVLRGTLEATGNLIDGNAPPRGGVVSGGVSLTESEAVLIGNAIVGNGKVGLAVERGGGSSRAGENLIEGAIPRADGLAGIGVFVGYGARLALESNLVTDNRVYGVSAYSDAEPRSEVSLAGDVIQRSQIQQSNGELGVGVMAYFADLKVTSSIVRDNVMAGFLLYPTSSSEIADSVVDRVPGGVLTDFGGRIEFGDGVIAVGAQVDVSRTRVTSCARAGFLFDHATGRLSASTASRNRFGLVIQGMPAPLVDDDNVTTENTERDRIVDGDFAVPSKPPALP